MIPGAYRGFGRLSRGVAARKFKGHHEVLRPETSRADDGRGPSIRTPSSQGAAHIRGGRSVAPLRGSSARQAIRGWQYSGRLEQSARGRSGRSRPSPLSQPRPSQAAESEPRAHLAARRPGTTPRRTKLST